MNDRTFHPLDSYYLVDIGNGRTNPVRITTSHTAAGPGVAA
ncbi:hypothetical protein OG399_16725 [Streptomyces achromogenes]